MLSNETGQQLLARWQQGSEQAAQVLVDRYMARLSALARSRLSRRLARRVEPDDIVLSAWRSFFVAAGKQTIHGDAEGDLWPLLVTFTLRKLARQAARHTAQRRSLTAEQPMDIERDWQAALSRDPLPTEAAATADEIEHLMARLSPADRNILVRRLQGDELTEIAAAEGCSERTVRRSLARVRQQITTEGLFDQPPSAPEPVQPVLPARSPERSSIAVPSFEYTSLLLHQLVGQGGTGRVYRATYLPTGETRAVKFLRKKFWRDQRAVRALLRENTAVAAIAHPGIRAHHGWGLTPGGGTFLVLEWVEGTDVASWVRQSRPSLQQAISCGVAVADAVAAAHGAGMIHGDLSPANVLRRTDDTFLLTDFGFARPLHDAGTTSHGGTPGYLAPEQLCDAFGPVSPATDVYALGGLLFFLLTGQPPISGTDLPDILAQVLSSVPAQLPEEVAPQISAPLRDLIHQCLEKEPAARPASAAEVALRLQQMKQRR